MTNDHDPTETLRAELAAERARADHLEARLGDALRINRGLRVLAQQLIDHAGGGQPNAVHGPRDVW